MTTLAEAAQSFLESEDLPVTQATLDVTVAWMTTLEAADIDALGETLAKADFVRANYLAPSASAANIAHSIAASQPVGNRPALALATVEGNRDAIYSQPAPTADQPTDSTAEDPTAPPPGTTPADAPPDAETPAGTESADPAAPVA